MITADEYRKRAAAMTKTINRRKLAGARLGLQRKLEALTDMADNEDWLEGKVKPKPTLRRD